MRSPTYAPSECEPANYYYEALQLNVLKDATCILVINDFYLSRGYLHNDNFNPYNPSKNTLIVDPQHCQARQYGIITYLQTNTTYILIITASDPNSLSSFSVFATASNKITFTRISKFIDML